MIKRSFRYIGDVINGLLYRSVSKPKGNDFLNKICQHGILEVIGRGASLEGTKDFIWELMCNVNLIYNMAEISYHHKPYFPSAKKAAAMTLKLAKMKGHDDLIADWEEEMGFIPKIPSTEMRPWGVIACEILEEFIVFEIGKDFDASLVSEIHYVTEETKEQAETNEKLAEYLKMRTMIPGVVELIACKSDLMMRDQELYQKIGKALIALRLYYLKDAFLKDYADRWEAAFMMLVRQMNEDGFRNLADGLQAELVAKLARD